MHSRRTARLACSIAATFAGLAAIGWTNVASASRRSSSSIPRVQFETARVTGMMPPQVIRRVVLRHFGEIRRCYEEGLAQNPRLAGRVVIRFVIGRDGSVTESGIASTTVSIPAVPGCIANAFLHFTFPTPDVGTIIVTYPMRLEPPEDGSAFVIRSGR